MATSTQHAALVARRRKIEDAKRQLIKLLYEKFHDEGPITVTSTALNGVLSVASGTRVVEEVELHIMNQHGKHATWREADFARRMLDALKEIRTFSDDASLHPELTRLFLSYLVQYERYLNPN